MIKCDICGKEFEKSRSLQVHKQSHSPEWKRRRSEQSKAVMNKLWNREEFKLMQSDRARKVAYELWKDPSYVQKMNFKYTSEQWKDFFEELYPDKKFIEINGRDIKYQNKVCGHFDFISTTNLYKGYKLVCKTCSPMSSADEIELLDYAKSFVSDFRKSSRGEFVGHEIDIYSPSLKIGFEYNGDYYHSSAIPHITSGYHRGKTLEALSVGIKIYHLWEHWGLDKCKDIIRAKLGKTKKIYGPKLELKEVSKQEEKQFLENYHVDGYAKSQYCYGLYKNNELQILMSLRSNKNIYEIARLCSLPGISVIEGPSILLNKLQDIVKTDILTYSLRDICNNENDVCYKKLGFEYLGDSGPTLKYFNSNNKEIIPRQKLQKWKLKELYPESYQENKSSTQILEEQGIYTIHDSGNLKFIKRYCD